jgi:hypothetical protein
VQRYPRGAQGRAQQRIMESHNVGCTVVLMAGVHWYFDIVAPLGNSRATQAVLRVVGFAIRGTSFEV